MKAVLPCAIYTRKSSEEGLEQGFNSLDAQREACEAFVLSQKALGWKVLPTAYDDGGYSGGTMVRPALRQLLTDIAAGRVKIVVVYKVDRLTRSLADFAKLVELFDAQGISFVSVTQQFNTTSSMGRLTLNVLLSFAQFEREVTGERIRDKIAASKRKGMWMGGVPPAGYLAHERTLVIEESQAERVREIYRRYLTLRCVRRLKIELDQLSWISPERVSLKGNTSGGKPFSRGHLYKMLSNPIYLGKIAHKGQLYPGNHPAIIDEACWQAVQALLAENTQGTRNRVKAINPSLLAGLLVDESGNRLAPTHARKGARRYRYYVSQAVLTEGRETAPESLRWPAHPLENAVLEAIVQWLRDESNLMAFMEYREAAEVVQCLRGAASLADKLGNASTPDRIEVLKRIVAEIRVYGDRLEIALKLGGLWSGAEMEENDAVATITVPVALKRGGMAVRLIVRGQTEAGQLDAKLIGLMARAYDWFGRLRDGKSESVHALAKEVNFDNSYVARVVQLAFLAPDIVERILEGRQPITLNAARLIRSVPLPFEWEAQRELLGIRN